MTGLGDLIKTLERQKAAIDRALAGLREIEGDVPEWVTGSTATASTPATTKSARKKRSKAVREKMRQSQLLRYARMRGEA